MNILGVQIIVILFAIFMVYVVFWYWKKKDIKGNEAIFWIILWGGFIVITLFPDILQNLTKKLFFTRVMDFLMIVAFMILTILGFSNYIRGKRLEKKIEEIVRKKALKNDKKK